MLKCFDWYVHIHKDGGDHTHSIRAKDHGPGPGFQIATVNRHVDVHHYDGLIGPTLAMAPRALDIAHRAVGALEGRIRELEGTGTLAESEKPFVIQACQGIIQEAEAILRIARGEGEIPC